MYLAMTASRMSSGSRRRSHWRHLSAALMTRMPERLFQLYVMSQSYFFSPSDQLKKNQFRRLFAAMLLLLLLSLFFRNKHSCTQHWNVEFNELLLFKESMNFVRYGFQNEFHSIETRLLDSWMSRQMSLFIDRPSLTAVTKCICAICWPNKNQNIVRIFSNFYSNQRHPICTVHTVIASMCRCPSRKSVFSRCK